MLTARKKKKYLIFLWGLFALILGGISLLFMLINNGKVGFMPSFEQLENPKSAIASEVISADQQVLGKYYHENRTVVLFDDLSPNLVHALIATEDVRFHEHTGIDWKSLGRVAFGVFTGQHRGGGSTITQQLAKNLFDRGAIDYDSRLEWYMEMALIKFKEWVVAVKLERNYTKEEILAMYLNTVPFGSQAFGVKSAAKTFFNTTPDSLKLEEAATLVGLLKAPSRYSPVISEETAARSLERRNTVLNQMARYGYIEKEVGDSVQQLAMGLKYNVSSHVSGIATYFREYLRQVLQANKPEREDYPSWNYQRFRTDSLDWEEDPLYGWCNKNLKANGKPYDIYSDGLKVYTTIHAKMQQYAEKAVEKHMKGYLQPKFDGTKGSNPRWPFSYQLSKSQVDRIIQNFVRRSERYRVLRNAGLPLDSIMANFRKPIRMRNVFTWEGERDTVMSPLDSIIHYKKFLRAGMMSMEPQTGHVRAYVGGINYKHFQYDNVMLARRQVGSTFKPFLYTLAMMDGRSPCDKVPNVEVSIKTISDGEEKIYTPQYSSTKREGEMISLKYGLAKSLNQISAYLIKHYKPRSVIEIARKMGVRSPMEPVYSLCVGAAEIKLSEMVGAYGTFADKGVYTEPVFVTRIEDKRGNVLAQFSPNKEEAIDANTAYKMLAMMQGVVNFGTSARLRFTYNLNAEIAAKTGTTNDNSDGWFIGIVPDLVSGVWVGGDVRSVRFASTRIGQGANMALPIWAYYMTSLYEDKSLNFSQDKTFQEPPGFDGKVNCDDEKRKSDEDEEDEGALQQEELFGSKEDLF